MNTQETVDHYLADPEFIRGVIKGEIYYMDDCQELIRVIQDLIIEPSNDPTVLRLHAHFDKAAWEAARQVQGK